MQSPLVIDIKTQNTKCCEEKLNYILGIAYDYIVQVLSVQERWIDNKTMLSGYQSVFPQRLRLSDYFFNDFYNEIKALCHDNPNFFKVG